VKPFLLGLWQRLRGTPGSKARAAAAVALGLFIGCQPVYGLHFVLVLAAKYANTASSRNGRQTAKTSTKCSPYTG
jgi:uncharacterized protein (DUF2062 family)